MTPHTGFSTLGWTLALAGAGFGIAMVPATSSALSVIPPEHSGMAASMTNTSRELGAVAGVAILGSVVNGQLTVDLRAPAHRHRHPRSVPVHSSSPPSNRARLDRRARPTTAADRSRRS